MNKHGFSWLVGAVVLALIASACTYEMPTTEVALDEQGGAGGATSSSSGPMGPTEDCLDGIDNDEDGAIDCADPDCTDGFTCTEALPDGWTRVLLERGDGEPPAEVPCANGDTPETLFANPAGPPECDACACGPIEGGTCQLPGLMCFVNTSNCSGSGIDLTKEVIAADCTKPDLAGAATISCQLTKPAAVDQGGTCAPSIADFANKSPWTGWVRACPLTTAGAGCQDGVCLPKSSASSLTCIRKTGSDTCPAGWNQLEAYGNAKDDRACGECRCEPAPECVGGGYEFYDFDSCTPGGAGIVNVVDTACTDGFDLPDLTTWSFKQILPEAAGSCIPSGGEPTGSVVGTDPVTFCCK